MQQPSSTNRLRPFRPTPFGRYTLLMPLSMGGMGEIFLARIDGPQGFEKLCVIKRILPHLSEDKDFVSRFVNEARTRTKSGASTVKLTCELSRQLSVMPFSVFTNPVTGPIFSRLETSISWAEITETSVNKKRKAVASVLNIKTIMFLTLFEIW